MATEGTLDDRYFAWLYHKVATSRSRTPSRSYWELCKLMYTFPFTWFVPNDHNRVADGKDLRLEFMKDKHAERDQSWMELECSILEMLVALGRRVSFEAYGGAAEWFWMMIQNLGLRHFTDDVYRPDLHEEHINAILEKVVTRTYEPDGMGGLFPLRHPEQDQREVEIWFQMASYLLEDGIDK